MADVQSPAAAVAQQSEVLRAYASEAFSNAAESIDRISRIELPEPPQSVAYEAPTAEPPVYLEPTKLPRPTFSGINVNVPDEPNLSTPFVSLPAAPADFAGQEPDLTLPAAPEGLNLTAPVAPSVSFNDNAPTAPTIVLPDAPSLSTIVLPTVPVLNVEAFTDIPPTDTLDPPAFNLNYNYTPYTERVFPQVESVLRAFLDRLDQRAGMPDEIEQILFERGRSRETIVERKAVEQATEEWSARGFALPQGELNKRIDEARTRAQDAVSQLSRETMIRSHDVRLENLRFAVQQGIVMEGQLIGLHTEQQRLLLESATTAARLVVDFFNAKVAGFNARIAGFNARVEAYRTRLQTEQQKLDLYRGQLEAARIRGDLNEQQVRLYTERVRAQLARTEIYRAQIEGYRADIEAKLARVQVYREQVAGFAAQVDAKRAEFGIYSEQVGAVRARADLYQSSVQAYGERVRAYSTRVEAALAQPRFEVENNRLRLEGFQASLGVIRERVSAQAASIRAQADVYESDARMYAADIQSNQAKAEVEQSRFASQIQIAQAAASTAISNANAIAEHAQRVFGLLLEANRAAATTSAQLAAGAMAAFNISAGISGSGSVTQTKTVTLGVDYNVEGGEASPPNIPFY